MHRFSSRIVRRERAIPVALGVLAFTAAVIAAALVIAAVIVPRAAERTARTALRDYASYFGATVIGNVQWDILRALHDRLYVPSRQALFTGDGRNPSAEAWADASSKTDSCHCVTRANEVLVFQYDDSTRTLFTTSTAPPRLARWLTDTLRALPRLYADPSFLTGTPLTAAVMFPGPRAPGMGVAVRIVNSPGGRRHIYGYVADIRPLLKLGLLGMMARTPLFSGAIAGTTPNDSLVALVVWTGRSDTVVTSSANLSAFVRQLPPFSYPGILGGVTVSVLATPTVMRLLQPSAGNAMIVPGLGAGLVLVLMLAIVLVWTMRRDAEVARAQSNFLATVSHELRTPAAQIVLYGDMLRLGLADSPTERSSALDIIVREGERLAHLVENALHVARGGSERFIVRCEPYELATLIEQTVERFFPLATEMDVVAELDLEPDVIALVDRNAITQIVVNVLDNAAKHGPSSQTIHVTLQTHGSEAWIQVDDEGSGVPAAERERIWQPYVRLAAATGARVSGSGIGLSVVRDLAEAHGGRTWIDETPCGGARFIVALPLWVKPADTADASVRAGP